MPIVPIHIIPLTPIGRIIIRATARPHSTIPSGGLFGLRPSILAMAVMAVMAGIAAIAGIMDIIMAAGTE
jgi:hypothetical protein